MINIKTDIEIQNPEQDELKSHEDVKQFISKYISNNYNGAVLLSGKWGIGKTSFLNLIEKEVKSQENKKEGETFIWLNAWKRNYTESFFSTIYKTLHPKKYFCLKYWSLLLVVMLAIVMGLTQIFPYIFKGTENFITISMLLIWLALFLINSIFSYFKDSYNIEDKCRDKVKGIISDRKLIFIIDDFDRVEKQQRNILFQHMSDINSFENALIIVVGEYKRIVGNPNDIFTQKILQNIENVPENYKAHNIWSVFENYLEKVINTEDITDGDKLIINRVRSQFNKENRTFREAKQLINRFENTYKYKNGKNFNPSELLALCYIFALHNQIYEIITSKSIKLVYKTLSIDEEEKKRLRQEITNSNIKDDSNITDYIFYLFNHGNASGMKYPSITSEENFSLYKIESNKITKVNDSVIEKYLHKDKYEGLALLDGLDDEDYIRFFEMFTMKVINQEISLDAEDYLNEMVKLIHYKFHGKHSDLRSGSFTFSYVNELLYNLSERLEMHLETDKITQSERVIVNNNDLNYEQKIDVIELIMPDVDRNYIENKKSIIEKMDQLEGNKKDN